MSGYEIHVYNSMSGMREDGIAVTDFIRHSDILGGALVSLYFGSKDLFRALVVDLINAFVFAFVEFYEEGDAKDAVDNMNESELYGRTLRVNMARQPGASGPDPYKPIWADEFLYRQKLVERSNAEASH
ncbi:hypothetical protein FOZ62_023051 [Perkinsus olseni]|uniref:RRM domain-containing protein n=1 Tax=Perkinsus olseni TaxID=32597 RepID=A0A7J6TEU5_PEROL|nr:hypothetical protein FOZ62_023051 [Perkinsus olseni]